MALKRTVARMEEQKKQKQDQLRHDKEREQRREEQKLKQAELQKAGEDRRRLELEEGIRKTERERHTTHDF